MADKELTLGDDGHHDGLRKHTCLHGCLLFLFPFPRYIFFFLMFTYIMGQSPSFFLCTKDWISTDSTL